MEPVHPNVSATSVLRPRRATRDVPVGSLVLGGGRPIRVQSMTTVSPADLVATEREIRALEAAGCELIRVAVPNAEAADRLSEVRAMCSVPLIADIHFHHELALAAIAAGVDKVRINPGNIRGTGRTEEIARAAAAAGVAVRIGVNSGSLEKDLLARYGWPSPEALMESALRHLEVFEAAGARDVVLSLKSSDVGATVAAYRALADRCDVPFHIGITEAGSPGYGAIKSAVGIGALLVDGLGDTIRVSLVGDPVREIPVAFDILKASGRRLREPEVIACPSCGRIALDIESIVADVERRIREEGIRVPVRVAILGCAVNGPGEAREADLGVAGGNGQGMLFRKGEIVRKVPEDGLVDALLEELRVLQAASEGGPMPA